jgi:magnesium chelatase subunit I
MIESACRITSAVWWSGFGTSREDKRVDSAPGSAGACPSRFWKRRLGRRAPGPQVQGRRSRPRVTDIYSALPAITGKLNWVEGELRGGDTVARELTRAVGRSTEFFRRCEFSQVINWFDIGGSLKRWMKVSIRPLWCGSWTRRA